MFVDTIKEHLFETNCSKSLFLFIVVIVSFAFITHNNVFAQQKAEFPPPIIVTTDKTVYNANDTITIFGNVQDYAVTNHVLIRVFNPNGELYRYDSTETNDDGDFVYKIRINKENISGEYRVQAFYGDSWTLARFMFISGPYHLIINNTEYPINYNISLDGKLNYITANMSERSITADIVSKASGQFTIELPRNIIDSKKNNLDSNFVAVIDSIGCSKCPLLANVNETNTNDLTRTLMIDYPYGETLNPNGVLRIKIVGTKMVPEFPMGTLMISISMTGLIVVHRLKSVGMKNLQCRLHPNVKPLGSSCGSWTS